MSYMSLYERAKGHIMFEIEKIKKLNETEFQIYNFLMEHMANVSKMTIRELAN